MGVCDISLSGTSALALTSSRGSCRLLITLTKAEGNQHGGNQRRESDTDWLILPYEV